MFNSYIAPPLITQGQIEVHIKDTATATAANANLNGDKITIQTCDLPDNLLVMQQKSHSSKSHFGRSDDGDETEL